MRRSRREWMEEFVERYRKEIADLEASVAMMERGELGLWKVENGERVDLTQDIIAKDKVVITTLLDLVARSEELLSSGELD